MKWKFTRIDWHKQGNCWRWSKIYKESFYSGNMIIWGWGRIAVVVENRYWVSAK